MAAETRSSTLGPATAAGGPEAPALNLLVAEDDPHDRMLFVMAADDSDLSNVSIEFATDGVDLLDQLAFRAGAGTMPDIVILDMRMPKLDGHEVLDALQENPTIRPPHIGVFSSSHRQQDIERSLEKGAAWHEVKPSKYEDLVDFIDRLGGRSSDPTDG